MIPPPLVIIVGPTAVGKTAVSIQLAKKIAGEIISGDSMQVYRFMNIGTAKPTDREKEGILHYMIDLLDPDEEFSVALFQDKVTGYIADILDRGKMPILVGGTGLYVRSVIDHYDFSPAGINQDLRHELFQQAETYGNPYLHKALREVDPATAERLHPNDIRRIIRALEVYRQTGRTISSFQYRDNELPPKYRLGYFGLTMDRTNLYRRIEQRVDQMVSGGLIEEVSSLVERGYSPDLTSMQGLGYKEITGYLQGQYSLDEAIELLKRNTRRFAKRQLTWFRRDSRIKWLTVENYHSSSELANEIASQVEGLLNLL